MQSHEETTPMRRIPLNVFIAGALSVLMVVMVSAFGLITYGHFQRTLLASMLSTLDSAVESNANSLSDLVVRVRSCVNLFPDMQNDTLSALLYESGDMYERYQRYVKIRDKIDNYLDVIISSEVSRAAMVFIMDESMPMSAICTKSAPDYIFRETLNNQQMSRVIRSACFEDEPYYREALEKCGEIVWFTNPDMPDMLFAAQAVRQTALKYGRVKTYDLGVMLIGFNMDWIGARLNENVFLKDASVYIAAGEDVVYPSGAACSGLTAADLCAPAEETDESGRELTAYGGETCFRWTTPLGDGLVMTTLVSGALVRKMAFESLRLVLVALTVILIVLLIATVLLVKTALGPIRRLSRHMQEGLLESVETPPLARRIVETNALYESFNSRNTRILKLMDDMRAIEREKREQDFRLLQAQINPHFIYNTLDSVSCMALIAGCDDIASAMGALAAIMRYNLKEPDKLVPLSTEMETVKSYIRIQSVRCAGELSVTYALAPESMACLMPKMSVETLIENAAVHVRTAPRITVSSRVREDVLTIVVAGEGDDGDAALIMRHLAGEVQLATHSTGLGIRNVDQRVKLLFGAQYGLRYERDGNALKAILTLPAVLTPPPRKETNP